MENQIKLAKGLYWHYWANKKALPDRKPSKCSVTPSLTIPDLSLSMDEMLVRYERGLPLPIQKTPLYEDENCPSTGRSIVTLDLIDIHNYKKSSMVRLEILRESVDKVRTANAEAMEKRNRKIQEYNDWIDKKRKEEEGTSRTNTP